MTEPDTQPQSTDPWTQRINALGRLVQTVLSNSKEIGILIAALTGILTAIIASKHGTTLSDIHDDVRSAKDVTVNTNQNQQAIVKGTDALAKNALGENDPAVVALEAATQPTTQK